MLRKLFCALTISLVLCGSAFASNEIIFDGGAAFTGQTLYFVLTVDAGHFEAGESWDGSNFITYTTTRSTFDVAMTEVGVTGRFRGSLPTSATAINKPIIATVYQDADDNGTPDHEDDIALQTTQGLWNGVKLISQTNNAWHSTTVGSVTSSTIITLASTGGASSANCYKGCTIKITDNADPLEFVYGVVTANTEVDLTYNLTDGQGGLTVATGMIVDIYQPGFTFDDRNTIAEIAVESISPIVVGDTRTFKFASRQQLTSPNIVSETTEFEGTIAFDMSSALNPGQTIQSVTTTTIDAVTMGDTEPSVESDDVAPDKRFVHITLDCSAADEGDYIIAVTILTTDGQTMTRRGRLRLE
jgi:hypothetical protein